jgi:hypothetical protein
MNHETSVPQIPLFIVDISPEHSHRRIAVDDESDPAAVQAVIETERRQARRVLTALLAGAQTISAVR